jgi:hypothetical protein
MPDSSLPRAGSAQVHVVHEGYVRETDGQQHVGGTVTLIIDGDAVIVVDPGMVSSREELLAAIAQHGVQPGVVTDVVFSHHHQPARILDIATVIIPGHGPAFVPGPQTPR